MNNYNSDITEVPYMNDDLPNKNTTKSIIILSTSIIGLLTFINFSLFCFYQNKENINNSLKGYFYISLIQGILFTAGITLLYIYKDKINRNEMFIIFYFSIGYIFFQLLTLFINFIVFKRKGNIWYNNLQPTETENPYYKGILILKIINLLLSMHIFFRILFEYIFNIESKKILRSLDIVIPIIITFLFRIFYTCTIYSYKKDCGELLGKKHAYFQLFFNKYKRTSPLNNNRRIQKYSSNI